MTTDERIEILEAGAPTPIRLLGRLAANSSERRLAH